MTCYFLISLDVKETSKIFNGLKLKINLPYNEFLMDANIKERSKNWKPKSKFTIVINSNHFQQFGPVSLP